MMRTSQIPARYLSFAVGLLSLGSETLWIRTYSFQNESIAKAFPFILGVYLLGIAFGAVVGSQACRNESRLPEILGVSLLLGAGTIFLGPAILATGLRVKMPGLDTVHFGLAFMTAFAFSICFPICHHIGTVVRSGSTGKSMSTVYAANIAGSVIGPLLVNFGLLQYGSTQLAFALLGLLATGISLAIVFTTANRTLKIAGGVGFLVAFAAVLASAGPTNWFIESFRPAPVRKIVETRQGIAVSYKGNDDGGDVIFGGNVYDGRTNLDPRINSNQINRVLVLSALRPNPKRVLVLGLSIGTWNYLITGFPGVEQIDAVEINPGYVELIGNYREQQLALADKRVRLVIADGRKFLRSVPKANYDLIVINTTFHWRAYVSLLLSREFLTLVQSRMAPGAVLAYNTTGSPDALRTAADIFRHAYLYDNFVVCSDFDWRAKLNEESSAGELLGIRPQGETLFSDTDRELISGFLSREHTATLEEVAARAGRPLEVITDRNLITEYKYGRPLFSLGLTTALMRLKP